MIFNYFQVLNGFRVLCSNLFALMFILLKGYKVLAFKCSVMVFVCRKRFLICKNLCLRKTTFIKEKNWKICLQKFFGWEISLTIENLLVCWKFPWSSKRFLQKISLTGENVFDCRKVPKLRKSFLTVEKFLDCWKVPWLWKTYFFDCRKK